MARTPPTTKLCPFTILRDKQEKVGFWTFEHIKVTPSDPDSPEWAIEVRDISLRRNINGAYYGFGDYCIAGLWGVVGVERKSMADAHNTLLGWKHKRRQFEAELSNLAFMEHACVIVEASLFDMLQYAPSYGIKTMAENREAIRGTIISWTQQYRVPWYFCGKESDADKSRRLAEVFAFRFLERAWRKSKHLLKE